ncbi:MAG: HAD-IB family hydrolase [Pseudomonadota bacterium]
MRPYADITRDVDDAPAGEHVGALFDLDGTLVSGFTVTAFFIERIRTGQISPGSAVEQFASLLGHRFSGREYTVLLEEAAASLTGAAESEFAGLGQEVFRRYVAGAIYPESRALVRAHQARGHRVAIVSSATRYQVEPVAEELGVEHIYCNHFETDDGVFTGRLLDPVCYGPGKLDAARRFAATTDVELERSFFYTDGAEDVPLLEAVGEPRPTNPDKTLTRVAARNAWPVRRFSSRGIPGARELIRTGLSYGAFFGSAVSILPTWLLNRSRRDAVNLATTLFGEFGTALAGIRLQTTGEQHLWSRRPALFLFNHQSAADPVIIARLLRRDFTGIAKKELSTHPLAGPVFRVADTVFIDRKNHRKAVKALKPVVHTLKRGLSVAIAPEGTRSLGDRLGPFKKGPFHVAMEAAVPIVPIVIRNATDVLPRGGVFVRPNTVYVEVLPPIDVSGWKVKNLDRHVADVRQLFLDTLEQDDAQAPER